MTTDGIVRQKVPKPPMIRGIDDKKRLLGFFAAKEHHNLVLRIVDVLELRNAHQDLLVTLSGGEVPEKETADGWRKRWFLKRFPGGFVQLPFAEVFEQLAEMEEIERLQQLCYEYAGVRLDKGEPTRIDLCDKCEGLSVAKTGIACEQCGGTGRIVVFIEMSDEERQLAGERI